MTSCEGMAGDLMGEAVLPCGISDLSPEELISPDCMTPPLL